MIILSRVFSIFKHKLIIYIYIYLVNQFEHFLLFIKLLLKLIVLKINVKSIFSPKFFCYNVFITCTKFIKRSFFRFK
jgi:hypothetical protein